VASITAVSYRDFPEAVLVSFRKRGRLAFNAQQVAGSGTKNKLRSVTVMTVAMILFFMVDFSHV
jgi:hypothetical protein